MPIHLEVINLTKRFTMHILGRKDIVAFEDINFKMTARGFSALFARLKYSAKG